MLSFPVETRVMPNGITVHFHRDNTLPIVSVNLWYRVGSANDPKLKSGLAHFFEHFMFQGSKNVPKGEHFRLIQDAGGILNASTSQDRTNFYAKVPSASLELVLRLEADRLQYLFEPFDPANFEREKNVVLNERLERYDNAPYGLAMEKLRHMMYEEGHPYRHPVIGYRADIESYTVEDTMYYFNSYYTPSNMFIVVGGDSDAETVFGLVEKHFGHIGQKSLERFTPKGSDTLTPVKLVEEYIDNKASLPRMIYGFPIWQITDSRHTSLELMQTAIAYNTNSRLVRKLVYEKQLCQNVAGYTLPGSYGGQGLFDAYLYSTEAFDEVDAELTAMLTEVAEKGITDDELNRVKTAQKATYIYALNNIQTISDMLSFYYYYFGTADRFQNDIDAITSVTHNDIKQRAAEILNNKPAQLRIIPGGANKGGDE